MADSWLVMAVRLKGQPAADVKNELTLGTASAQRARLSSRFITLIRNKLNAIRSGVKRGNVVATVLDASFTASTGNIACTRANASGDTITFTYGGQTVVLTEGTSGENGFARGASDTTCASNLATCINAHSVLGPLITAAGAVGDCGLTVNLPTCMLQDIAITTSDGTAFGITALTGGNEGAAQFFPLHFSTGVDL